MAGMFYSLEEVIGKLSITEDQVTQLVTDGKLKEFRDGDKVLFKVDQVNQLAAEGEGDIELTIDEDELISLEADDEDLAPLSLDDEDLTPMAIDEEDTASMAIDEEDTAAAEEELVSLASDDEEDFDLEDLNLDISSEGSSIELLLDETMEKTGDLDVLSEESAIAPPAASESGIDDDFDLADLSSADTNVGTTGINVLADTDDEYKLTNDTKSETVAFDADSTGIGSLDDDLNMDSIGSGSGLLDLSLQADDTSLGAVLDDILPAAGEVAGDIDLSPEESHMADEADKIFEEAGDSSVIPQSAEARPTAQYFEIPADKSSNIFGITLFIPFIALVYAIIVVLMGTKGISPGIVSFASGEMMGMAMIWVIVFALMAVSLVMFLIAALSGGKSKNQDVYQQAE